MKFIIEFDDEINPVTACECVRKVVEMGKISNNGSQYCFVSTFTSGIVVGTAKNKASHRFVVRKEAA